MPDHENEKHLEDAIKAAKAAGQTAMNYFGTAFEKWDKSPNNPVTEADLHADRVLQAHLKDNYPHYGWLSEETKDDGSRFKTTRTWVVDPIDGTRAFIKNLPHFSISIALIENGAPIIGVVHNPATNETFHSIIGRGAYKNDTKIMASSRDILEGASFLGDPHMFAHKSWPSPWPPLNVEQRNSIAYRMVLVASGEFDGAIATQPKNDWDIAAGTLIVKEAGGIATDHLSMDFKFDNETAKQRSLVVAGKNLHPQLISRLSHIKP